MKNSETEAIKLNIREQTKILNDVRNTKAYKAVEGYHFLKGQKGIGKIQKTGEVLKHICCQADKRIQSQDPLEAVLKMQAEGEEQINSLGVELTEYQGCMQILSKILEVKNTERKVICVFAPYEMMDQPDGYARRIKNIDVQLLNRQNNDKVNIAGCCICVWFVVVIQHGISPDSVHQIHRIPCRKRRQVIST